MTSLRKWTFGTSAVGAGALQKFAAHSRRQIAGAFILAASVSLAGAAGHGDYVASVATYKPMAGFTKVVGDTRFVGYFLAAPGRCDVTVFEASAEDDRLVDSARRVVVQIAAGGRSELGVGANSALAIACTSEADTIKIAPQTNRSHEAQL